MEKINLKEILISTIDGKFEIELLREDFINRIYEFAKEACRQTLELAANTKIEGVYSFRKFNRDKDDRQSILNVINLIE